ncbi:MAG TPA: flagellar export chaperone FliS [Fimbriimonadaceae bacterium]|nr:flagellar export chaperone FliS [Fimbriimonadaceae bacterium]HRJ33753.1 flagellar export chaperone FliS [Fimbriimonadaceae bacterium]
MATPQRSQVHEYRKNAVNGASPLQLIIMLYDGALRFMEAGKTAMQSNDLYNQNLNLQRAQRIVTELISCLDMKQGGEIAQNLFGLYSFIYNQLVAANIEDRAEYIDQCLQVMQELRTTWSELEQSLRTPVSEEPLAA